MRKYLSYAKKKTPKLTVEVEEELLAYYVDLRKSAGKPDDEGNVSPIPITPRQLEALIRLSEASAKIRLDTHVRKQDAARAKGIFISCMEKIGIDPDTGGFDIDMISSSVASSERNLYEKAKKIIIELSDESEDSMVQDSDVFIRGKDKGLTEEQVDKAILHLIKYSFIYEPVRGKYKKL